MCGAHVCEWVGHWVSGRVNERACACVLLHACVRGYCGKTLGRCKNKDIEKHGQTNLARLGGWVRYLAPPPLELEPSRWCGYKGGGQFIMEGQIGEYRGGGRRAGLANEDPT